MDRHWTGKAWGLHVGLQRSNRQWILCVDADVLAPQLVRSLLHHAERPASRLFPWPPATLSGKLEALIHPAMLTTLIYRFGSPGRATKNRHNVQANGQCFFSRREILLNTDAFRAAQASLCEDITIVRRLRSAASGRLLRSRWPRRSAMYDNWRETWHNWPRSLPMRDQYFGWRECWDYSKYCCFRPCPCRCSFSD